MGIEYTMELSSLTTNTIKVTLCVCVCVFLCVCFPLIAFNRFLSSILFSLVGRKLKRHLQ